jgi:dienelactone hydrolase
MSIQDAEELITENVDYTDADSLFEGYVVYAPNLAASKAPCVLVMHDWSGLNQSAQGVAQQMARLGYVGFALDVYGKGVRGSVVGDNSALLNPLMANRALLRQRLLAGLIAAQKHPLVDGQRLAALGHCFGGLCALDLARAAPRGLKGAVSIHGVLTPPNIDDQPPITTSILILHGWEDPFAPSIDMLAITQELTSAGADWQIHAYGHAKHAFTHQSANMPERGLLYDAKADRRSGASTKAFFREVFA